MLRKEPIVNSTSKNWDEQQALFAEEEVTPNVAEVVWGVTTYKAVRGIYLLGSIYVRTSSLASGGDRVCVDGFGATGLSIGYCWGDDRRDLIGLAGSRKQQ